MSGPILSVRKCLSSLCFPEEVSEVKRWYGKANILELTAEGPNGAKFQGMSLRLYNPEGQQWSLHFASSHDGALNIPTIGAFDEKGPRRIPFTGDLQRPGDLRPLRDHACKCRYLPLRTILLRRRRQELGGQLDRDRHAGQVKCRPCPENRSGKSRCSCRC